MITASIRDKNDFTLTKGSERYYDYKFDSVIELTKLLQSIPETHLGINLDSQNLQDDFLSEFVEAAKLWSSKDKLRALKLDDNKFTDDGAEKLAQLISICPSLVRLDLARNNISDSGATAIAQAITHNPNFEHLDWTQNNKIGDAGVTEISKCLKAHPGLKVLRLHGVSASSVGFTHIAQGLATNKSLKALDLYGMGCSDESLIELSKVIKNHPELKELNLSDIGTEYERFEAGWHELAQGLKHSGIEMLDVSLNHSGDVMATFTDPKIRLKILHIECCSIHNPGAEIIANNLAHHPTLEWIDISSNSFDNAGVQAIQAALQTNNVLTALQCGIFYGPDEAVVDELIKFSKKRPALEEPQEIKLEKEEEKEEKSEENDSLDILKGKIKELEDKSAALEQENRALKQEVHGLKRKVHELKTYTPEERAAITIQKFCRGKMIQTAYRTYQDNCNVDFNGLIKQGEFEKFATKSSNLAKASKTLGL